jgi:hypothetical protein
MYRLSGESGWKRGLTHDISDSGVLFEVGEDRAPETVVELTFHLPEKLGRLPAGQLTCIGKVVRQPDMADTMPPRAASSSCGRSLQARRASSPPDRGAG